MRREKRIKREWRRRAKKRNETNELGNGRIKRTMTWRTRGIKDENEKKEMAKGGNKKEDDKGLRDIKENDELGNERNIDQIMRA